MKQNINVTYVCASIGNLTGIPIRLYEGKTLAFYRSVVDLPKDPFDPYREEVFAVTDHVGYFVTPHDDVYGVVNFNGCRLVVGPTRQIPLSDQELHEIAFEAGVPTEEVSAFITGLKSIASAPLANILQLLCLFNHLFNDGEELSVTDVFIAESEQARLAETIRTEQANRSMRPDASTPFHTTMDVERTMLQFVRNGDVAGVRDFFKNIPAMHGGVIAPNALRQSKNIFVVAATLVSRAAVQGGLDPEEAMTLSDGYVQRCELLTNVESVTNLTYRMVVDYAERVERLQFSDRLPSIVAEVNRYIRRHLSESIRVQDMASALCRGRSRLSSDFKQKTGENLSEYILKQKIEEGKKLLRYTDKPAVDIAFYLGFSSQSHFSRTFKKYAFVTPNEYRTKKEKP